MKKQFKEIRSHIDENIKIGDTVRLIDGSGLCSITHPNKAFYIIYSYPFVTGSHLILTDMTAEVVQINISNIVSWEEYHSLGYCYQLDIIIKLGDALFRTCSKFVTKN